MGLAVAAVIPVRQFPKTTSGKIQRFALARDFEDGRFADVLAELARARSARIRTATAPRQATSSRRCWRSARPRCPNRTLTPDDNLFELGTGSLTLAQIYEKVEATYPGYLEVTDFFEYPTVRAMAAFLAAAPGGSARVACANCGAGIAHGAQFASRESQRRKASGRPGAFRVATARSAPITAAARLAR